MVLIDETILVKYALGEATPGESSLVESWVAELAENRKTLEEISWILQQTDQMEPGQPVAAQAAWQRMKHKLENPASKPAGIQTKVIRTKVWWMSVAASLIVVAGIAIIYFLFPARPETKIQPTALRTILSGEKPRTDTLPDGSVVDLASHSSLQYPVVFSGNSRDIRLNGEAFFTVEHNRAKPFIVSVNDLSVTVVGTSFRIRSSNVVTEVIVTTGLVQVKRKKQELFLSAGERIKVLAKDSVLAKTNDALAIDKLPNDISNNVARQKEIMQAIIADMMRDQLVKDKEDIDWFALNEDGFTINDKKQAPIIYKKYRQKYLLYPASGFYYGPSKITGRGFFFSKQELEK